MSSTISSPAAAATVTVAVMDPNSNVVSNLMTQKEEGNSKMGGGNSVSVNHRTRLHYFKMCKRKMRLTNVEPLPDELVFDILLHVSAQDIYDNAKLVCRNWYHNIIHTHNFIHAHFQHTTCGLLIQHTSTPRCPIFVTMRQGRIEMSKFRYNFRSPVWASCNGLVLEIGMKNLYITNPVTKQKLALPLFSHEKLYLDYYGIAYAAASKVYKVVVTYTTEDDNSQVPRCAILTVGVDNDDSWRHVNIQHLSHTAKEQLRFTIPMVTEGFMHWSLNYTHFLTMNVETEIITENFVPPQVVHRGRKYCFSTGRYLSLLIECSKFSWDVWEMKPETGEWTKLLINIDLEDQKCTFEGFGFYRHYRIPEPLGWLKYQEVLVFGSFGAFWTFVAYNVRTQEIDSFALSSRYKLHRVKVHRNSLLWLGG